MGRRRRRRPDTGPSAAEAAAEEQEDSNIYASADFEKEVQDQLANIRVSPSDMQKNIDTQSITTKAQGQTQTNISKFRK